MMAVIEKNDFDQRQAGSVHKPDKLFTGRPKPSGDATNYDAFN